MGYRDWSTAEVARQLKSLGFGQYSQEFQANEICGVHLPLLTEDHLKEMGVLSIGHRILIQRRFADIISGKFVSPVPTVVKPRLAPKLSSISEIPPKQELPPFTKTQNLPKSEDSAHKAPQKPIARAKSDVSECPSDKTAQKPPTRSKPLLGIETTELPKKTEESPRNQNADQDSKVPCPYCGRRFFADLAQRHMNVCSRINSRITKK
jgi:hypothetical protein